MIIFLSRKFVIFTVFEYFIKKINKHKSVMKQDIKGFF